METNLVKYLRARRPIIWVNSGDYKEIDTIVKEATRDYKDKAIYEYRALGAVDFENKVKEENIDVYWVPGAFEIPLITKKLANTGKYDAIIALGAVIKGSTPHFDYVCAEVSKGVAQISLQTDLPVIFGVLTTNNIEETIERAGTKAGNKGSDAAFSAIEMINLIKEIEK